MLPDDSQGRQLGVTAKGTGPQSHLCNLQAAGPRASRTPSCARSLGWETQQGLLRELNGMIHMMHSYGCGAQLNETAAGLCFSAGAAC